MASRDAIVVLGCQPAVDVRRGSLARRVARASQAFHDGLAPWVVASGGRRWGRLSEASILRQRLVALGVPQTCILTDERSLNTIQNARFSAHLLSGINARSVFVVTCDFHLRRSLRAFRSYGIDCIGLAAMSPTPKPGHGLHRALRELASGYVQTKLGCIESSTRQLSR